MRISIFGLGYVGMVNAACLAQEGHTIIGVDVNPSKVQCVNAGQSPVVEAYIDEMVAEAVCQGRLRATTTPQDAVLHSELSMVCVGTPSTPQGTPDSTQVDHVCHQIGTALRQKSAPHTLVMRSTLLPGSTARLASQLAAAAERCLGTDLHVAFQPEFLREGSAVRDFYHPPFSIIGTDEAGAVAMLEELYHFLSAPTHVVTMAEAELLKYCCNAFHATKITFANEIGRLARAWEVNGRRVMELLCQDTVLNISPAYLRPGLAYGGSCLPKDVRALVSQARLQHVHVPLIEGLAWSNSLQIDHAYELITQAVRHSDDIIGILGFTFKDGTDDLRESPIVACIERLLGKGYRLLLYDEYISLARLMGTNKAFIEHEIPHLAHLMTDSAEALVSTSRLLVVSRPGEAYTQVLQRVPDGTKVLYLDTALGGPADHGP